jgi:hypothetical protein
MAGSQHVGPLGSGANSSALDQGTLARTATPEPGPVGASPITAASAPQVPSFGHRPRN